MLPGHHQAGFGIEVWVTAADFSTVLVGCSRRLYPAVVESDSVLAPPAPALGSALG